MASIRQRNGRRQARIIRKGHPDVTKTFRTKQDAERWSRATEVAIDKGALVATAASERITLGDLVGRYLHEVTPTLKGAQDDAIRLRALMRHPICRLAIARVTPSRIAKFRDERLGMVHPGTVIRELAYLSAIFNHARREWEVGVENPVSKVRKPSAPAGRERILSLDEEAKLIDALKPSGRRSPWVRPLVQVALETAMRRGELLSLRWKDVSLESRTATLFDTKNGEGRVVPLSSRGIDVLAQLPRSITGYVFPITACAASAAFERGHPSKDQ